MRVFITSTPSELETCQARAIEIVRELGHEPVLRDPVGRRGMDPVSSCRRQVALAEAVLAIVGWRRGRSPSAALGGDNLRSWSYWEVQAAFENDVPVASLLASERFLPDAWEEDPETRAVVADFRGELARLGAVFDNEANFERLVREQVQELARASRSPGARSVEFTLRRFGPPKLPKQPYPLLLPYTHPDFLAGREEDLAKLHRILDRPITVVGLHAASGTGKSSLLSGGLVPALRAEGRPVAFDCHPSEPGLMARLLGNLVETGEGYVEVVGARSFVDRLVTIRRLAGGWPPVLVVDQFEDLLKDGAAPARALLGPLLAASAQRLPGLAGPPCRWVLALRQEYHGKLVRWLEDVLREARTQGSEGAGALPHNLSGPSRFVSCSLRPLAAVRAGTEDAVGQAARVFLDAIEKPLVRGGFGWTFAPGHAKRLARAFAEARRRQPDAPLVPELQVVLAHLLERAGEPAGGTAALVEVPEEVEGMIDRALEEHLRRALDFAFPYGEDKDARVAHSQALLVLRQLAGAQGRRDEGLGDDELTGLGEDGREVLEKLSTARTRIVLRDRRDGAWVWRLSHDRLAEVLVSVVDEELWGGRGVDPELLALRRFVVLQSQLHEAGDVEQATVVPAGHFAKVEAHREVLLWSDAHRRWWEACRTRRLAERRRRTAGRLVAAVALMAVTSGAWTMADRWARRQALLEEVASGESEVAFAALGELTAKEGYDPEEILEPLRRREASFDVVEKGLGGMDEDRRAEVLVRVAELAMPILEASPEDPVLIASLVWALDFFAVAGPPARDPAFRERASGLRDEALEPLRRGHPPPPLPGDDDPDWARIPAGTFWMGARPEDVRDKPGRQDELPRHQVTLSAFRMLRHEVTNAEYRRLVPEHEGDDNLPAGGMTWYEAYTYAAWLGGRLPTESEWEYAARAGCHYEYCRRDGSEATLDEVAWWLGNSVDRSTGSPAMQPVMRREPNPWGLWDLYGNVHEWNATWHGSYPETRVKDPPGPTSSSLAYRTHRGGCVSETGEWLSASYRGGAEPDTAGLFLALRVVIADDSPAPRPRP